MNFEPADVVSSCFHNGKFVLEIIFLHTDEFEKILPEQLRWHALPFVLMTVYLAALPTSSFLATSKPRKAHSDAEGGPLNLLCVSDRHATEWEFPHYVHARDILVFCSHVTLIPLPCVLSFYTKTWKALSWTEDPRYPIQMSLRGSWASSCKTPGQASFRHLPLGVKLPCSRLPPAETFQALPASVAQANFL